MSSYLKAVSTSYPQWTQQARTQVVNFHYPCPLLQSLQTKSVSRFSPLTLPPLMGTPPILDMDTTLILHHYDLIFSPVTTCLQEPLYPPQLRSCRLQKLGSDYESPWLFYSCISRLFFALVQSACMIPSLPITPTTTWESHLFDMDTLPLVLS